MASIKDLIFFVERSPVSCKISSSKSMARHSCMFRARVLHQQSCKRNAGLKGSVLEHVQPRSPLQPNFSGKELNQKSECCRPQLSMSILEVCRTKL